MSNKKIGELILIIGIVCFGVASTQGYNKGLFIFSGVIMLAGGVRVIKDKTSLEKDKALLENKYDLVQSDLSDLHQKIKSGQVQRKLIQEQLIETKEHLMAKIYDNSQLVESLQYKSNEVQSLKSSLAAKQLKEVPGNTPSQLINNRTESRQKLIEILKLVKKELIMVCPWISENAIDETVKNLIDAAMKRGVTIHIGYGYLPDVQKANKSITTFLKKAKSGKKEKQTEEGWHWKYTALEWLEQKAKEYPRQLNLKILGTHQKYLVCDNKILMLGSHNFLTSGDSSEEKELGIEMTEPPLIEKLRLEFFESKALDENDCEIRTEPMPKPILKDRHEKRKI
jgi:phosphatidylserine/phosphatidylglycerophosphate/cardiolipin synthase-like enzyme